MSRFRPSWQALAALVLVIFVILLGPMTRPEAEALANPTATINYPYLATGSLMIWLLVGGSFLSMFRPPRLFEAVLLFVVAHLVADLLLTGIAGFEGSALTPYYMILAAAWLLAWRCVTVLSTFKPAAQALRVAILKELGVEETI